MILIPAAGEGRRFTEAGYKGPKHLLNLAGTPMIDWVIDNVFPLDPLGEIYVANQDWVGKTKGAVDTILKATSAIQRTGVNPDLEPLVIANCDQLIKIPDPVGNWGNGIVFTFKSSNPAHSYVTVDDKYQITSIVEKPTTPPSLNAVSGVYCFPTGGPFLKACRLVSQGISPTASVGPDLGGEQYVSSALAMMIASGLTLYAVDAPTAILGTPEDFQRFEVVHNIIAAKTSFEWTVEGLA